MGGQIIPISNAGRELVALENPSAMLGFLEAAAADDLANVYSSLSAAIDAVAASVAGKAAASHQHAIADVTGLQGALDGKAAASHQHAIAAITGLQAALDARPISQGQDDVPFIETITWTGTTAPSGSATLRYEWQRIGKIVVFRFRFEWTVAGSAIIRAEFPFPQGMPAPSSLTGGGANEVVSTVTGGIGFGQLGSAQGLNALETRIQRDASGNPGIWLRANNTNLSGMVVAGSYICQ